MPDRLAPCPAWEAHLAGWCVAQLSPVEEAGLVEHLHECRGCRAEADSLMAVAAVSLVALPGSDPWRAAHDEPPPADLADRIVARVGQERRRQRGRRAGVVLAALAGVLVLALALRPHDPTPLLGDRMALTGAPGSGAGAHAIVAREAGGSLVALTARGLDPTVTYALWLTPPGGDYPDRVPAGTFRPHADGSVDVRLHSALPPDDVGRIWATGPGGEVALDTKL